jgi:Ca2+-binding RTX toxin-like protein
VSRWLLAVSLGVVVSACRGTSPPSDEEPPTKHRDTPSATSTGNAPAPSKIGTTPSDATTGTEGEATDGDATGGDASPPAPVRGPVAALPARDARLDTAPSGCVKGATAGVLALRLDATVPVLELRAEGGVLLANGTACSDAAERSILLSEITALSITGGSEDDSVTLDLGAGDWSGLFALPESLQIALGDGDNGVLVRGSEGADVFRHAMRGTEIVLDLTGAGNVDAVLSGLATLGVSLGAGDDRLEDLVAYRATLANSSASPPALPELTALSVPLFAAGGDGNDWLVGGTGNDQLDGGDGDDVLSGLDGDDLFLAGSEGDGTDIYNGGAGYDQLSYELRSSDLQLFLCRSPADLGCSADECACPNPSGNLGENDLIVNIEELRAGSGNDLLRGSDASESLRGGPGNDTLFGGGGSDLLDGEQGDDVLDGGADGDICDGSTDESVANCEL